MPDFYDGGRRGDGRLVALIHGAGSNHTVWHYQARHLAHRGLAVRAFDLPGHGDNPGCVLERVEELADWVAERLPAATAVIGHSLGALVALELTSSHPENVSRLGLLACSAPMAVHPDLQSRADSRDPAAVGMIIGWSYDLNGRLGGHPEPGANAVRLTSRLVESELAALGPDLRATAAYERGLEVASRVAVPTLVLAGTADRMVPPRATSDLAASIPGARFLAIAAGGHFLPTDSPDQVRSALSTFLLDS